MTWSRATHSTRIFAFSFSLHAICCHASTPLFMPPQLPGLSFCLSFHLSIIMHVNDKFWHLPILGNIFQGAKSMASTHFFLSRWLKMIKRIYIICQCFKGHFKFLLMSSSINLHSTKDALCSTLDVVGTQNYLLNWFEVLNLNDCGHFINTPKFCKIYVFIILCKGHC